MAYLLDANVFIQAKNLHYGFDFCQGFWDWLVERNQAGLVFSIEKVGDELDAQDDELRAWSRSRGRSFFLPPDEPMLASLSLVADWVTKKGYEATGIATFLSGADYYLVAHAHAHGHAVVTHEVHSPSTRRVKIPTVCIGLGVKCMTTFELLRKERARLVLHSD